MTEVRFPLRLDGEMHQKIDNAAKSAKRSMNSEICERLENYQDLEVRLAQQQREIEQLKSAYQYSGQMLLELAGCESVFRMKSSHTTYGDREKLQHYLKTMPGVNEVLLAVRPGDCNHSALSVILVGNSHTLVADNTLLTVERTPREYEVLDLMRALDNKGLLETCRFVVSRAPQTEDLPAPEALATLTALQSRSFKDNQYEFLRLFFDKPEQVEVEWFEPEWATLFQR